MITRVKICCIGSRDEAAIAVKYGASAIGLVSEMPSGPGVIPEELIAKISVSVPPGVASFLLTSRQDANAIVAQQRNCLVNALQLCNRLLQGTYPELRAAMPGVHIMQVIHVTGEEAFEEAQRVAPYVDGILLDSGDPNQPSKALGGTGRTHDWNLSCRICETIQVPVFLAGGLNQNNVAEAIRRVRPYGVDICSGVRTNGRLDGEKLLAFFAAVNATNTT